MTVSLQTLHDVSRAKHGSACTAACSVQMHLLLCALLSKYAKSRLDFHGPQWSIVQNTTSKLLISKHVFVGQLGG